LGGKFTYLSKGSRSRTPNEKGTQILRQDEEIIWITCLGVFGGFTPPPNTLWQRDPSKNIPESIENGDGANVLSGFRGERDNNLKVEDGGL
jgi:hypothetical protein